MTLWQLDLKLATGPWMLNRTKLIKDPEAMASAGREVADFLNQHVLNNAPLLKVLIGIENEEELPFLLSFRDVLNPAFNTRVGYDLSQPSSLTKSGKKWSRKVSMFIAHHLVLEL